MTPSKKHRVVNFNELSYRVGPDYETILLNGILNLAVECDNSQYWLAFLDHLRSNPIFAGLDLADNSPLENTLFLFFDEGVSCADYAEAFHLFPVFCVKGAVDWQDERVSQIARRCYDGGLRLAHQFKQAYQAVFAQVLRERPYQPNWVFIVGCESVGLPVGKWIKWWPDHLFDIVRCFEGLKQSLLVAQTQPVHFVASANIVSTGNQEAA